MIRRWPRPVAAGAAVAAGLAAGVLVAALPATAAVADAGPIVIDSVSSPPGETGLLSVQAEATSPITSLTVNIYSGATLELTIPYDQLALTSGSTQDGVWTVTSPLTMSQLALGTYQVTVDATDLAGDAPPAISVPGSFFFGLAPAVTLTASTTTLDYFQQSVTFSGQVTATGPDGTIQPIPVGQQVSISDSDGGSWTTTTTDAGGDYSVVITPDLAGAPGGAESFSAAVSASATTELAVSPDTELTTQVDPVQVTVALSQSVATFGAPVTFSGTALIQVDGTWLPYGNSPIDITGTDFYSNLAVPTIVTTTAATGQFIVQLPSQPTTTWAANPAPSPYLTSSYSAISGLPNMATLTVALPTKLTSIHVAYNPAGQLVASGCLGLAPAVSSFPDVSSPPDADLFLQYSRAASGPWRTLGGLDDGGVPSCGAGRGFRGVVGPAALSGYYRTDFTGQLLYQSAASTVVHAATVPTRFADFSVRPAAVSGHGRITVSGRLQAKAASWKGLGSAPVTIYIEPAGGSTWYWYRKLHVSRSGAFSVSFADPVSGHWAVGYAGNSTHLESTSRIIYVRASGTTANLLPELRRHALSGRAEHALLPAR